MNNQQRKCQGYIKALNALGFKQTNSGQQGVPVLMKDIPGGYYDVDIQMGDEGKLYMTCQLVNKDGARKDIYSDTRDGHFYHTAELAAAIS